MSTLDSPSVATAPHALLRTGILVGGLIFAISVLVGAGSLPEGADVVRSAPPSSAVEVVANNLAVVLLLATGWVTFGISTIAVLAWNGFVVGIQAAAAASEFGWLATIVTLSAHGFLEVPALLLGGAVGALPAVRTATTLRTGTRPPSSAILTAGALGLSAALIVAAALVEVSVSPSLLDMFGERSQLR